MAVTRCLLLGLVVLATGASPAAANPLQAYLGTQVQAIEVSGGEQVGLAGSEALKYVDIQPGDRFSIQAVRRSVKLLYHLGLFGQVRVLARPAGAGVALEFVLVPKRRVVLVEVVGCEEVAEEELVRLSRLIRGDEYDHWKLEASTADMLAAYRRHGYRRVRIVAKAEETAGRDLAVRFFIQEGPPTRISRIWFKGRLLFGHARLRRAMDLDRGDVLDEPRFKESLIRLQTFYRKRGHLQVRVESPSIEPELEALWEVVPITIEPGPVISFGFEGNQVIRDKDLIRGLQVKDRLLLNPYALADLSERLARLYRQQGFARVRVQGRVDDSRRGGKRVVFRIEEGPRVTVRALDFDGNRAYSDRQLTGYVHDAMAEAVLQSGLAQPVDRGDLDPLGGSHPLRGKPRKVNQPQGFAFELVPETMFLREPYEKAIQAIEDVYLSQGYLEVEVGSPLLSYSAAGSALYISMPIHEGPQTRVESLSFSGNQAIAADRLLAVADRLRRFVKPGAPLDQYGVEMLRKELGRTYAQRGYLFCRVSQQVTISKDKTSAEVNFSIQEGPQVRVGRVLVRGDLVTAARVFDRVVQLRPGEIFSPDKVASSKDGLQELGVFSSVDIKLVEPDRAESVKDVVVHVRERLPHDLTLGPGLSTAEGVRLMVEYTHRNLFGLALESVTRAKINYQVFYPLGDPLVNQSLADRISELNFIEGLEWQLMSGLHWPSMWFLGRDLAGRLDLVGLRDHHSSFDLTKVSVIPGVDFKWTSDLSVSLEYEFEFIDLTCVARGDSDGGPCSDSPASWERFDEGQLPLGAIRPVISWDRRDDPFNPHRGTLLSLRTELAHTFEPNRPVYYMKMDGQVTGYIPLSRRTTLALSMRLGGIFHLTDDSSTPAHKLFYLGGRNSMRGFPEEGLIPADQGEDPSNPCQDVAGGADCTSGGGNFYLLFKVEFRFPLFTELLAGALFVDAGNLWTELQNVDPFVLRPTAGFGLRLATPIGPLAIDLGFNLMPDEGRREESWSLHFNVGVF